MQKSSRYDWIEGTNPSMFDKVFIGAIYPRNKNSPRGDPPNEGYTFPRTDLPPNLLHILFSDKPNLRNGNSYRSFPSTHPDLRTAMSILDMDINLSTHPKSEEGFIPEDDPYRHPISNRVKSLVMLRRFLHEIIRTTRRVTLETVIRH